MAAIFEWNVHTIIFLVFFTISIILALFSVYSLHQFYQLRHEAIIKNRRGNLVIYAQICCIVILFIGYPFSLLRAILLNDGNHGSPLYYTITTIYHVFFNPFYWFQVLFTVARFWLIYYDIQFSTSCLNLQWKYCINKSDASYTNNEQWFVAHRHQYGNQQYIMRRTTVLCIFTASVSLTTALLHDFRVLLIPYHHILSAVMIPFIVLSLCCLSRKLPPFYDHIYLYKEAKLIAFSWCLLGAFYLLSAAIPFVLNTDSFVSDLLFYVSALCGAVMVPFFSTFWVLWQLRGAEFELAENMNLSRSHSSSRSSLAQIALSDILGNKELFHSFMQHVIMEFSMESLLALIELNQFKQRVVEVLNVTADASAVKEANLHWLSFPDDIPLSDIVHVDHEKELTVSDFKLKAHNLYKKYIANGAAFEINISFKTKKTLHGMMRDCDAWCAAETNASQLAQVFDGCILEMMALLNGTKLRFKEENVMTTGPARYLTRMQTNPVAV